VGYGVGNMAVISEEFEPISTLPPTEKELRQTAALRCARRDNELQKPFWLGTAPRELSRRAVRELRPRHVDATTGIPADASFLRVLGRHAF